ncbi:MAG: M28 family peptidase [Novosphingobium sp.]|uniref:M28 family peptidase n=1 Tax=Novosphingobium sp. TaxID=1874826 RepID=UPI001D794276|nr:M28 family peptidase [Novosphingobium sp.]MCB2056560.1 M28 family peptidase [Novosphingobium sp.]MCP5385210.1 M28 family peptidase [Novosphingobium sp.]
MTQLHRPALTGIALCLSLVPAHAARAAPPQGEGVAWDIVADLTTEIGPRLAGSPREAAARDWAVVRLKALGFQNVRVEPFTIAGWVRGAESAELTGPYPQRLHITALGNSAPTPVGGLTAPVVYFASLDALRAAPAGSLAGKIAYIDHAFVASQDGSGYGPFGQARRQGPAIGASKGALAVVIRSIGTDHNRDPHTGGTNFPEGTKAIPAGAVSGPDADLIARIAGRGQAMTIHLVLEGHAVGELPSGNVLAELPGRDPSLAPVLLACHLDSWDLGTGAIDDGAGCGIITAAALNVAKHGQPLRTIRLLWAGSEEVGVFGGAAYAKAHASEPHALAMESDFGADRVWRVSFNLAAANKPLAERIAAALAPLGIPVNAAKAGGGADIGEIAKASGAAVIDLDQDGTRYFDLHHTPDDTLDKVDPAQLAQNVEAWTRVLAIVANETGPISGAAQ